MCKYLILTSLLALTACMGGGTCLLCGLGNDEPRAAFAGTPKDVREANESVTKMETVIDYTTRAIEIYEESGLSFDDNEVWGFVTYVDGIESEQYKNMSNADKLKLGKAAKAFGYISSLYSFLDGGTYISQNGLENALKMLNAFYKVESKGRIKDKFNVKLFLAEADSRTTEDFRDWLRDKLSAESIHSDCKWVWDVFNSYVYSTDEIIWGSHNQISILNFEGDIGAPLILDDDGKIVSLGGIARDGTTNTFNDGDYTITLETFGDGKLSYSDFGYITGAANDGSEKINHTFYMGALNRNPVPVVDDVSRSGYSLNFKGTAVGLYVRPMDSTDPAIAEHDETLRTTRMQTDNATLHLEKNGGNFQERLTMPFSEDGWYDVKYVQNGPFDRHLSFSNYKGNNSVGPLGESVDTTSFSATRRVIREDALEYPKEVVGSVGTDFADGGRFEAAYGVVKQ